MHLSELFRSTGVKLAAACAAFFFVATLITVVVAVYKISDDLDSWLDRSLTETSKYLINEYKEGGMRALSDSVDQHAGASQGDNEIFLLVDNSGKKLAGNVKKFKVLQGWHDAEPKEFGLKGRRHFRVLGQKVGDATLIIARNDSAVYEIGDILENAFLVGAVIMALSALFAGLLIGVRAQKRVEAFTKTLDAVSQGQINSRVDVVPAGGDDIDHIARKLNLTLDHLSSAMLSMQQVTVDIAHDLKSPIARLRNRLIDCIAQIEPEQDAKKDLLEAIGDADQISHTFDAMLRIAQIESGERRQHFESLNLAKAVDRAVEIYGAVVEDAGGRLSVIADKNHAGRVVGDEQLLLQLLANLIENSLSHCQSAPRITLTISAHPGGTTLSVADNGPGIPESERERVKERFYRLDKSRSSKGTGLGLALVVAIANLHGAKLNLSDNSPGLLVTIDFRGSERA